MTATTVPRAQAAAPRWWADAAGILAGLSLLIVAVLWIGNRGTQQVMAGGAEALTALGRLTGLLSADLLLLQALLMARIPLAERAFGQDRLARWHRWTGFTSFHLMVAHVALVMLGYGEVWEMIFSYPGMLLATAGTLLVVMVVATSLRAARRRMRYESWHLLHLYGYLGIGLALPHQLWTGGDFASSPAAEVYWWTLYGVAAAAVVVFRLGLPAFRNARHRLTINNVVPEGPGLTSLYLSGRRLERLPVRAGQFFQWRFLDGPGWSRSHPYSLSAVPHSGLLRITVKALGDGSGRVASLKPGTRALFEGPYGRLTGEGYRGGRVVLLACGIGITPLLALLGDLPYPAGMATLVYRARSEADVAFRAELEWFARYRGVRVVYLIGPRAGSPAWLPRSMAGMRDVDALAWMAPGIADSQVYVCGPPPWTEAACAAVRRAGVAEQNLRTEQFAW